ncbi:OB-fold protein [Psychrobacter celer]|uniref:OB-fold protein n=1 Tax=Psychrobacter celer TaxID=306572 RepID=UPI003FD584FD
MKWAVIIVVGLIVLGFIGAMLGDDTDSTATSDASLNDATAVESSETALPVTAQQLFDAYDSNEVAADKQYKGKLLQIDGKVASIDSGFTDNAQVQLATSNDFMSVTATGNEAFDDAAASLSKGQSISLLCRGEGEIIGSPMVGDCVIQ